MKTEFIVRDASAQMPASCKGHYRRVAVMEVERGTVPRMISPRAKGVVRVVETWENLNVGKTDRCAFQVALREAKALADRLNGGSDVS